MTISYPIQPAVIKEFVKDSQKRGYSEELAGQYVQERTNVAKKYALISDTLALGTIAATAGKIALNAKADKTTFLKSATTQFAPFMEEINKVVPKFTEAIKEKSFLKGIGKGFIAGVELFGRTLKGTWKSIPPMVKIPAAILMAGLSIKAFSEQNKVDAKYDTLKYLEEHKG